MKESDSVTFNRDPLILAVETSGMVGSVAICRAEQLVEQRCLAGEGQRHAQALVSEVDRLIRAHGMHPQDFAGVAVSAGPGSFTGLRVGIVFAKTFAWLNGSRLLAVDTLRAIANQAPPSLGTVCVISDAQRGELFAASYCWNARTNCRDRIDAVKVITVDSLPTNQPLTGPALIKLSPQLAERHQYVNECHWQPTASAIGAVGFHLLQAADFAVPEALEPVYIRPSYAEEKRVRQ
jgi:tRNA threonylcarbamoyladenosine biosynthesis protein TsaB